MRRFIHGAFARAQRRPDHGEAGGPGDDASTRGFSGFLGLEVWLQRAGKVIIQRIMGHRQPHCIEKGDPLLAVLGLFLGVSTRLFRHPELLKCKPARVGNDQPRGVSAIYASHPIDRFAVQQPFLLGQRDWAGLAPAELAEDPT